MLALRSILAVDALDRRDLAAAKATRADAVLIDLAHPSVHGRREEARANAARAARAIAKTGRPVIMRVGSPVSGQLEADLDAVAGTGLAAVVLADTEQPQDARDADVQIRKREMRLRRTPGDIRLVAEIGTAEALAALPSILQAVDRYDAVSLDLDGLYRDLRLDERADAIADHAMAVVAVAAHAVRIPWIASAKHHHSELADIPVRAHAHGAAGVTIHHEAAALGVNSLFTPDPVEVSIARAMILEWDAIRGRGEWTGVVAGEVLESSATDRWVDRRAVRRARALLARVEAIEARERLG